MNVLKLKKLKELEKKKFSSCDKKLYIQYMILNVYDKGDYN